jgi:hypothetical protein
VFRAAVAASFVVLFVVPSAAAYDTPTRLTQIAHVYSGGVGEVRCDTEDEWNADPALWFSWSYTNLRLDYSVLPPFLCEGALGVGSPDVPLWQQAAGAWTLVQEAFHLRHWRFRRNEAKVLCQAIVYFTDAAMRLGATEQQANELYPYALALHTQITTLYRSYRDPACIVPPWILPPRPYRSMAGTADTAVTPETSTEALARARQIAVEVDARYAGLRVNETSSTGVIDSLTLFDDAADPRVVAADNGIYYGVCPNGASCPFPGRAARPATALMPRRIALELAARTFLETSANLVVVCLPTRGFILLVFERDALDSQRVTDALADHPPGDRSLQVRRVVDANTLPHLYVPFALVPEPSGLDSLLAWPLVTP